LLPIDALSKCNSTDATNIDRLNIGPLPTIALNWLQPHEGSIVDFLFNARAYQTPDERLQRLCAQ
jgi:phage repressor protein C with HTH and peptisase S24 domain